jgi:L-threonylcarbamoyladenylate synthase
MIDDIKNAIETLKKGGIILYPTDTVWGIGCDATREDSVERIFEIKNRADRKAMLILLESEYKLTHYVAEVPEIAWELIEVADRPMTLIYPGAKNLARNLIAEDGSIGIRISHDPFCSELIRKFGKPIVSTSANISGEETPVLFSDISKNLINSVNYVVKWRQDDQKKNPPSSIIKLGEGGIFKIIRY